MFANLVKAKKKSGKRSGSEDLGKSLSRVLNYSIGIKGTKETLKSISATTEKVSRLIMN